MTRTAGRMTRPERRVTRTAGWMTRPERRVTRTAGRVIRTAGRMTRTAGRVIRTTGRMTRTGRRMIRTAGRVIRPERRVIRTAGRMTRIAGRVIRIAGRMTRTGRRMTRTTGRMTRRRAPSRRLLLLLLPAGEEGAEVVHPLLGVGLADVHQRLQVVGLEHQHGEEVRGVALLAAQAAREQAEALRQPGLVGDRELAEVDRGAEHQDVDRAVGAALGRRDLRDQLVHALEAPHVLVEHVEE